MYGLDYITQGNIDLSWPIHNDVMCKLFFTWYMITDQLSSFTLTLFAIERFIVVYFPLRAKTLLSFKNTLISTGLVLFALSLFSSHLYFSIRSIKFKLNTYCAVDEKLSGPVLSALYWIWIGVESYLFPNLVSSVLNIFILHRILSASSKRHSMSAVSGKSASTSAVMDSTSSHRERRATISLVLISIAHSIVYTPEMIMCSYVALTFLELIPIPSYIDVNVLMEFSWMLTHMTNVGKVSIKCS